MASCIGTGWVNFLKDTIFKYYILLFAAKEQHLLGSKIPKTHPTSVDEFLHISDFLIPHLSATFVIDCCPSAFFFQTKVVFPIYLDDLYESATDVHRIHVS